MTLPLLQVNNLNIQYKTEAGYIPAVKNVSFSLNKGESLGLIGESGCGKTTIGMSILRLLPENVGAIKGSVLFKGLDILALSNEQMRTIRGAKISMIFQAAMNSLNPVHRVGDQIIEALQTHDPALSKTDAAQKVEKLFKEVGLAPDRIKDFPHQYSGGMKQRAVIAMALACSPELIIADEPTTALDMVVQSQILSKLKDIQKKKNIAVILVSHDIGVISEICHNIIVIFKGEMIEYGTRKEILEAPVHPYTKKLISSCIKLSQNLTIPAFKASEQENIRKVDIYKGCHFYKTCSKAGKICKTVKPELGLVSGRHSVRCHLFT